VTIVLPIQPEKSADKELRQLYAYVRFGQINSTARVSKRICEGPADCLRARRCISLPIYIVLLMQRRNRHYEQTRNGGGFESLHSRRRPDLQRRNLARHLL